MQRYFPVLSTVLFFFASLFAVHAQDTSINWMPVPQQWTKTESDFVLDRDFTVGFVGFSNDRLERYSTAFLRRLDRRTGLFFRQERVGTNELADLRIIVERAGELVLGEDESYQLEVDLRGISLRAQTDFGAMRGLETLLQLLTTANDQYVIQGMTVNDAPRFPWRGLMIDVSRHFQPVEVIKRNIDGMAAVKMNVLHLHLVDDHGFRVESKRFPELNDKASKGEFFTQNQVRELVQYAADRGIRVVPEFDVPGHASAFLTAFPHLGSAGDDYTYELQTASGIFDPTFDPTNEATYETLNDLFTEMSTLFPDEYFHIGGDENEGKHWLSNEKILQFMKDNGYENQHELQNYFVTRIQKHLTSLGKKTMGWDEILTKDLPKDAIIHSWRGIYSLKEASTNGYKCLLSNGYYIDLMKRASDHYQVDPIPAGMDLPEQARANIMGGEATMWSELVVAQTIDSRIWPRVAAIAERLWSPADVRDVDEMYQRLDQIALQLDALGLGHLNNQHTMMRNLTGSYETGPLKTLVDVAEPMEIYTRNPGGNYYLTYYAFNRFADITTADARDARIFTDLVKEYQLSEAPEVRQELIKWLEKWRRNHREMKRLREGSPALEEVMELSQKLSVVAGIGLDALTNEALQGEERQEWWKWAEKRLDAAAEQTARTELQVVEPVRSLIRMEVGALSVEESVGEIKVDGRLGEWENATWQMMQPVYTRGWTDTCQFSMRWDERKLYLATKVTNRHLTKGANGEGDEVIVSLLINEKEYRLRAIMPGKRSYSNQKVKSPLPYQYAVRVNGTVNNNEDQDKGYQVELGVEWKALGVDPGAGTAVRANLTIVDEDQLHMEQRRFDYIGLGTVAHPGGVKLLLTK